ncbi:MAG: pitrilysin family protein, partial [Verrucomicrobia bacterium]|nr:pitrilysin family protein [Verrucomicrobiota bacterium]
MAGHLYRIVDVPGAPSISAVASADWRCIFGRVIATTLRSERRGRGFFWAILAIGIGGVTLAQQIPVTEKTLSNGMKLLMVERSGEPRISGGWVAHVGSSNEKPGMTGIAHLFEHMMFKGTPTLGTKDAVKDREIMEQQERLREEIRVEESKLRAALRRGDVTDITSPESKSPRHRELEAQFKKLIDAQHDVLVKNEFDRVYTTAGASGMNAFTTQDMTAYYISVPANKLELWMWMESERLLRPVFREFYAERDVVFEERRMRTESTPIGKFAEQFNAMFWEQNLTLILVGDFKSDGAVPLAERYFGRIPRGSQPPPEVTTLEIPSLGEKRYYAEAETNPEVEVMWRTVGFGHKDSYSLEVVQQLLLGRTGRLHKGLVLGSQVSTEVSAQQDSRKWAGAFDISAEVKDGHTTDEVEKAIEKELERLRTEDVPAEELQKVKNNFAAAEYRKLSANTPI